MNKKIKINRLKFLIHKYGISSYGLTTYKFFSYSYNKVKSYLYEIGLHGRELTIQERRKLKLENIDKPKKIKISKHIEILLEIKKLCVELNIDEAEYYKIRLEEGKRKYEHIKLLEKNNLKETRDNKGVYIGNGGSNIHKIRYPKKTRSNRTWRIFYKMFPNAAISDNFDGKTSKRMK